MNDHRTRNDNTCGGLSTPEQQIVCSVPRGEGGGGEGKGFIFNDQRRGW